MLIVYLLKKIPGKNRGHITDREYETCRNYCFVFKGTDSVNETLDYVSRIKGEAKRVNNKIVKFILYLFAHKGSGFDSYVVLINLPQRRTDVSLIKNGSGIVFLRKLNGSVDQKKGFPQKVPSRCGLLHIKDSSKNIGKSYTLQSCLLKQELEHDEIYEDTWEEKESE